MNKVQTRSILLKNCYRMRPCRFSGAQGPHPPKQLDLALAQGARKSTESINKLFCTGPAKKEKRFFIPFKAAHDEKISVIQKNDKELLVPLRQFCDTIGIDWSAQLKKLKNDSVF